MNESHELTDELLVFDHRDEEMHCPIEYCMRVAQ